WQGAVRVSLYERDGADHALIELIEWRGAGTNRVLYDGPVAGVALVRNQGSTDSHCFHIASTASVRGSKTNWPRVQYERGQGDDAAPEEIRTPDPQIRSLVLYPAELRARLAHGAGSVPGEAKVAGNGPLAIGFGQCWQGSASTRLCHPRA